MLNHHAQGSRAYSATVAELTLTFFLGVSIGPLSVAHIVVGVITRAATTVAKVAARSTAIVTTTAPTTARAAGAIDGNSPELTPVFLHTRPPSLSTDL